MEAGSAINVETIDVVTKTLLVLHGLSAAVLGGAAVHNATLAWSRVLRGARTALRLRRVYPPVIAVAYLLTFGLGLWLYPQFRVEVRAAYLDIHYPLLTALFEVKEHWLAIGLGLLAYLVPSSRHAATGEERDALLYDVACLALGVIVASAAVVGLILTAVRPV